ncbi:carbon-nitrogen hydrolase family protein [Ferviditalea candida]|uniref:Carbon-nitrogen hydrolase family protein n=1 Tax=Ferviditalea candida TaxID=3108399 RepID=A0ABU5ZMC0_9BACL|nr:carbon-nitrogen hydrolase family protein [Paenibacillaceae bacterium T2]
MIKTDKFQIAVVQGAFDGDVSSNLQKMKQRAVECKELYPQARLLLFPELAANGYGLNPVVLQTAETMEGRIFSEMSRAAEETQMYIAYGYVEKDGQARIYNSLMLINPRGEAAANYRKIHMTPYERSFFKPGDEFVIADTELGRIGLMICWDLAFPEAARKLAAGGAELLLAPSAWEMPYDRPYRMFSMARAIDNTVYLAASNHTGCSGAFEFFGQSAIYAPDGTALSAAKGNSEQILAAEIDYAWKRHLQESFFTMMNERRTDLY